MGKAVPRATGQPLGMKGKGGKPQVQTIKFDYLEGLSRTVGEELRQTEDALLDYIDAQQRRDSLYAAEKAKTTDELVAKYPALDAGRAS